MSTQAPWLALSVDWQDSNMFGGATPEERLAWISLLCYAKTSGRAGVVKFRLGVFTARYQISKSAALGMLERATAAGAIENGSDGVVSVVNWRLYQDPKHRPAKPQTTKPQGLTPKRGGFNKSAQNDATTNHLPHTTHPGPLSSPTPPGGERAKPLRRSKSNKQAEAEALTLYEAYPIHRGKLAALKAIRKALKDTPMAELLPKVEAYAASEDVQAKLGTPDVTFIPRAATWFNAGSWMDETTKTIGSQWLEE